MSTRVALRVKQIENEWELNILHPANKQITYTSYSSESELIAALTQDLRTRYIEQEINVEFSIIPPNEATTERILRQVVPAVSGCYFNRYQGDVNKNGQKNGEGMYTSEGYSYKGGWKQDVRHGFGVAKSDRIQYTGYWEKDKYHGEGRLVETKFGTIVGLFDHGRLQRGITYLWNGEFTETILYNVKGKIIKRIISQGRFRCVCCGVQKPVEVMFQCKRCWDNGGMFTFYCGKECQRKDWKEHGHGLICQPQQQLVRQQLPNISLK